MTRTLLACSFLSLTSLSAAEPTTAITHVTVVPMDREARLPEMTVLVAEGRILGLGRSDLIAVPEGAEIIDGRGKYLLPGLMDMHVHEEPPGFPHFVKHGVTMVRIMGGSPEVLAFRKAVLEGRELGPMIVSATPPFQPQEYEGTWQAVDAATAREGVRRFADQGVAGVKVIRLSDEALAATIEEAGRHRLWVGGHLRFDQSLDSFIDAGVRSVEHIEEAMWAAFGSAQPTDAELRRVAVRLRDAGVSVSTLLGSGILGSEMRLKGEGALETEPARRLAAYLGSERTQNELIPAARQMAEQRGVAREANIIDLDKTLRFIRVLYEEGVNLVAGTDGNTTFAIPGESLHDELQFFRQAGLTPYQTIRTATANAAALIDAADDLGSITVGKIANLILVDGDPLDDISVLREPAGVMVRGVYRDERALRQATASGRR